MKKYLVIIFFIIYNYSLGQTSSPDWNIAISGDGNVYSSSVDLDKNGNTYFAFTYRGKIKSNNQVFPYKEKSTGVIVKIADNGEVLWSNTIESEQSFVNTNELLVDSKGNILVAGYGEGKLTFFNSSDTLSITAPERKKSAYIVCYSPNGDIKWNKYFNSYHVKLHAINTDNLGKIYVSISHKSSLLCNDSLIASKPNNSFANKTSILTFYGGEMPSVEQTFGGQRYGITFPDKILFDNENNLILSGSFDGNIPLNNDTLYGVYKKSLVVKVDSLWNLLWQINLEDKRPPRINDILISEDNSIYLTGSYNSECIIQNKTHIIQKSGKGKYSSSFDDNFLFLKISEKGDLAFCNFIESKKQYTHFRGKGITLGTNGKVYVVGDYRGDYNFGSFSIHSKHNKSSIYTAVWNEGKIDTVLDIGYGKKSAIYCELIKSVETNYVVAGKTYYGNTYLKFGENKIPLKLKKHERGLYIYGGRNDIENKRYTNVDTVESDISQGILIQKEKIKHKPKKEFRQADKVDETPEVNIDSSQNIANASQVERYSVIEKPQKDSLVQQNVNEAKINIIASTVETKEEPKIKITGRISDVATDELISYATVQELRTTNGTFSNSDGLFALNIYDTTSFIEISSFGYDTLRVPANELNYHIALNPIVNPLKTRTLIQQDTIPVDSSGRLKNAEGQTLQGKATGVQVRSNSGSPGAGMDIVIRGRGTVADYNRPLYVVDGVPVGDTLDIDPAFIESISILKDDGWYPRRRRETVIITTYLNKYGNSLYRDSTFSSIPKTKFKTETAFAEFIKKELDLLARQHNIVESVDVHCFITETGKIDVFWTSVEFDYIFNQRLITILEEGQFWLPAFIKGQPVSTLYMFEFNFTDN